MSDQTVYDELGVPRVVNAAGTKTRIGGSRIRPEAVEAMGRAATEFVRLSDLQAKASEVIADATGAEAGYVTCGADAGLLLAAAAPWRVTIPEGWTSYRTPTTFRTRSSCHGRTEPATITRSGRPGRRSSTSARTTASSGPGRPRSSLGDRSRHLRADGGDRLRPETVHRTRPLDDHGNRVRTRRSGYRRCSRGTAADGEPLAVHRGGSGPRGLQRWEGDSRPTDDRYRRRPERSHRIDRAPTARHARCRGGLATADIARRRRASRRRPTTGDRPAAESRQGGTRRSSRRLESFLEADHDAARGRWRREAERVTAALESVEGIDLTLDDDDVSVAPEVVVHVDTTAAACSATQLVRTLRTESPRVFVGADRLDEDIVTINPMCLTEAELDHVIARIRSSLTAPQ